MKQIEELYHSYSKQIFNYFYYLTYDVDKSNDLLQETFYQAILSIVRFKGNSKISTWLYSIARNTYLKDLRKEKNSKVEFDEHYMSQDNDSGIFTPEEVVEKKETLKSIAMVLNKLPEKYSTVLVLRDKEGLSYKDIAQITGLSDASVKVNLHRARQKFREEFRKIERGEVFHG